MRRLIKKIISIIFIPFVLKDYFAFKSKDSDKRFSYSLANLNPQIKDKTITTGFDRHYVYHTSWAVRKVKEIAPAKHIDISSSLYFSGLLSAFIPVEFYDYRPAELELSNFESKKGDLMQLPFADNSVESISCMHTIEHVGLGRYGDPIDPEGDKKAIKELIRVTKQGGHVIFVTPVGKEAVIEYNAHRIYTYDMVLGLFKGMQLAEFSLIPERAGGMILNASKEDTLKEHYACGCFVFKK